MTPADKLIAREARRAFALTARQPDAAIDLAHAALLIASEDDPRCDVAAARAALYRMGLEARERVTERVGSERVAALNAYLFGELGFAGNQGDYYDVRNSLLHLVLDRRKGIPITLSLVYIDVARRAGLGAEGVGLPGHFVVRVRPEPDGERALLVDPFHARVIDEEDCQQHLDSLYGGQVPLSGEHLRALPARETLARVLRNMKAVYVQSQQYGRALACAERVLLVAPGEAEERRDHGMLLAQLGRPDEARRELELYLADTPKAPDAEQVGEAIKKIKLRLASLN